MIKNIIKVLYEDYVTEILYEYIKLYDINSLNYLFKYLSEYRFRLLSKNIIYLNLNNLLYNDKEKQRIINCLFYILQRTPELYIYINVEDDSFSKKIQIAKEKIKQNERIQISNKNIDSIRFNKICLIRNNKIIIKYNCILSEGII